MALTAAFRDTVRLRASSDAGFRAALLGEAVELLLAGDVGTGKAVLRNYINATVGFDALSRDVGIPAKSLMRMFSAAGNPRADNIFSVINRLQSLTDVQLAISAKS